MPKYTCNDYRLEMRLIGLKRQLVSEDLSEAEKRVLIKEIEKIEEEMGIS